MMVPVDTVGLLRGLRRSAFGCAVDSVAEGARTAQRRITVCCPAEAVAECVHDQPQLGDCHVQVPEHVGAQLWRQRCRIHASSAAFFATYALACRAPIFTITASKRSTRIM